MSNYNSQAMAELGGLLKKSQEPKPIDAALEAAKVAQGKMEAFGQLLKQYNDGAITEKELSVKGHALLYGTTALCISCGKPAEKFRDELGHIEYGISGFCQDCQDSVFCTGEGCTKPCCEDDGQLEQEDIVAPTPEAVKLILGSKMVSIQIGEVDHE